ncbi:MAG: hypothetical protein Sapg2KO_04600 [Saprospiraceae bacterium]
MFSQSYEIQLINNTSTVPNGPGTLVDIYVNDSLYSSTQQLNSMEASTLISLPTGEPLQISIASSPSDSIQQSFVTFNFNNLEADKIYAFVLDGAFGNPDNPFRVESAENLLRFSDGSDQIALRPYNGNKASVSNDFFIQRQGFLAENLNKGDFGNYQNLNAGQLILDLFEGASLFPASTYSFDFSNSGGQAFTLLNGFNGTVDVAYAVSADGTVIEGQPLVLPNIIINELDYDQPGTDGAEFIELKNIGETAVSLAGLSLEFWNGSVNQAYNTVALPSVTLAASDYFVICFSGNVPNCDLQLSGSIQNGGASPDGVLLLSGIAVVDALSYEGDIPLVTEGDALNISDNNVPQTGLSRIPDGADSNNNSMDFQSVCITPGAANQALTDCSLLNMDSTFVQFINNYEAGPVDVYLGAALIAENIGYQTATAFLSILVSAETTLSFVPSGEPIANAFLSQEIALAEDQNYLVVIEGTAENASLVTYDLARTEGSSPFAGDFNVYHGVENGPELDLIIKSVGQIADGLGYQDFSGYSGALPGVYLIELITPANQEVIATFELDMRQSAGKAQTILISNEASNANNLELISIDANGLASPLILVEFASVQLIHNIPNIIVDLYVDDRLIADNVNYRSATSFLEIRANKTLNLEVKGENSTPASEAVLSFDQLRFPALSASVVVLGGDGTDDRPVDIFTLDAAQTQSTATDEIDLAFFHGATDFNPLSISSQQFEPILPALDFGQFSPYQSFNAGNLVLFTEGGIPLNNLDFYGADLSQKAGQSGIVFSSGIVGGSETFGLFIAFSDGAVVPMDTLDFSRIQMVHNVSNDLNYDVYLNGDFFAGPLGFQEATPYLNILAGTPLDLAIVPSGELLDSAVLIQEGLIFVEDSTYQVFVNAQMEMPDQPGILFVNDAATEVNETDFVYQVGLFHGALDAVDLNFQSSEGLLLGENISYGQFASTPGLAPANTLIEVIGSNEGNSLGGFNLPLLSLPPASPLVIFTSISADAERNLELLAVLPDGQVIPLQKTEFARLQIINLLAALEAPVDIYLDGERIADDIGFRNATAYQTIRAGKDQILTIAPQNSVDTNTALFSQIIPSPGAEQVLAAFVAPAAQGSGDTYQVYLNDRAEINAGGANKFTFNFFNGNSDQVDLDLALQGITTLYRDVSFGDFTNYTLIEPLSSDPRVTFELTSPQNSTYQGDFFADFSAYDNLGATIFASGGLSAEQVPAAELWVVLPDGTTAPLELIVNTEDLSALLPELTISPNPSSVFANLDFRLEKRTTLSFYLIDVSGKIIEERRRTNLNPGKYREQFNVNKLAAGTYFMSLQAEGKRSVLKLNVNR